MADRLTQLQEAVNQLADYFCNSIGVLQQAHESNNEDSKEGQSSVENNTSLFATLITRTAGDIDILIDSLPSQEYTPDKQVEILKKLEIENRLSAEKLSQAVTEAESLLVKVRETNKQISDLSLTLSTTKS